MISNDDFVEWAKYGDNYYGTSKSEVISKKSNDSLVVLDIDLVGAKKLHSLDIGVEFIAIMPPSFEDLEKRLLSRGTENIDVIKKRLEIGKKELEEIETLSFIKHKIVNDNLEDCSQQLDTLVKELYPFLQSS